MRTGITIYDGITPELNRLARELRETRPLMAALTKTLANSHRRHWRGRGGKFWADIARACVEGPATPTSGQIIVGHPRGAMLLHKIRGGTVYPKTAKALSIPLTAAAKKTGSASRWETTRGKGPLTMVVRKNRPPLLVETALIGSKRTRKWTIHYVLLKSVTHRPDPAALPPRATVDGDLRAAMAAHQARVMARAAK
jgi:hypothetical protein